MDLRNAGSDEMERVHRLLAEGPWSQKDSLAVTNLVQAFIGSANNAVRQWQYDPPANGPIAFTITVTFNPGAPSNAVQSVETRSPANVQSATWTADGALRVGGNITPPTKIKDVRPVYPDVAQQARVTGVVIIEARIEPDGHVGQAHGLRSIPLLDQAAIEAVLQWKFTPTLMNGQAVPVVMTVTVNFSLQ